MAILDPDLGRVRHVEEHLPVMSGGELPFARLLGAFGAQDLWTARAAGPARVQPGNPVALVATDTGEDRTDNFVGEKEAPPGGFERARTDAGRVEPGGVPALPQCQVQRIVREDRLVCCRG